jgi:hypothetical protein
LERFRYEGGEGDPISMRAFISKGNAADVRAKLARPLANTSLKVGWYIIDFDGEQKLWFEGRVHQVGQVRGGQRGQRGR